MQAHSPALLKPEPASPLHIYEDGWLQTLTAFKHEEEENEEKEDGGFEELEDESKAQVYSKLLEDLDQLGQLEDFIKEEPFSNWLEEKVDLPIFDDIRIESRYTPVPRFKHEDLKPISHVQHVPHIQPVQPVHALQAQAVQAQAQAQAQALIPGHATGSQDTNMLLQEFETVFGAVEMTHGQLTPPQSPPLSPPAPVLTQLTPISYPQRLPLPVYYQQQPATPQPDVAHELAVVEELVRSRAENLVTETWDQPAPSSPSSSSSSSFSEYSSDPEWIPETIPTNLPSSSSGLVERARGRKRSGKPYAKIGPEDKKSRKKEQNKNAATRYRLKKKAEIEEILTEERGLADAKAELEGQVSDLQREIKCLKGLMRDLFKAKGLIN